jgi:hypothetical protein
VNFCCIVHRYDNIQLGANIYYLCRCGYRKVKSLRGGYSPVVWKSAEKMIKNKREMKDE